MLYPKLEIKVRYIDFWYVKINLTWIWYKKFIEQAFKVKNSLHCTLHEFISLINVQLPTPKQIKNIYSHLDFV